MAITPLPPAPQHSDSTADFIAKADAFVAALNPMVTEINGFGFNSALVDNITALKALSKTQQNFAKTRGYYNKGDGGHGDYRLDATDTTSADDGYSIIVASDGGRWKLLTSNILYVSQAGCIGGATNVITKLQAVISYALALASPKEPIIDLCGFTHSVGTTLVVPSTNLTLRNGGLVALSSFVIDGGSLYNKALVGFSAGTTRVHCYEMVLDGAFYASGIYNAGATTDTTIDKVEIKNALLFGIYLASTAPCTIRNCLISQSQNVAAKRTGDGIYVGAGDTKIFNNIVRYFNRNLAVHGGQVLVEGNHFYNGSPAGIDTPIPNSINIEIESGSNCIFAGNYIDKGRVVLRNKYASVWANNTYLFDTTPIHDSIFVFDCINTVNKNFPSTFIHVGSINTLPVQTGAMDFIEFISSGTGNWTADTLAIATYLTSTGRLATANGECNTEVVTDTVKVFYKTDPLSEIQFQGYGITSIPVMRWENKEFSVKSPGFVQRVIGSGSASDGTLRVEGSRTGTSNIVSALMFTDRRGSTDLTLSETALGFCKIAMYGNTGSSQGAVKFQFSAPGSATVTDQWIWDSSGITPGSDNVYQIGNNSKRLSQLAVQKINLFPAASETVAVNGQMVFQLTSNTQLTIKVKGSDGVTRSANITLA